MAATTISRAGVGTDDDGSGNTGTAINAAYIGTAIYDAVDALFSATTGITLNQAGGDGSILTVESSDVAHGMTTYAATAAYGLVRKNVAASGGLDLLGLSSGTVALQLNGYATTDDTTKSAIALAPVVLYGAKKSGTGIAAGGANANVVVIQSAGTTRFIFDVEGDSHEDGTGWTAYDAYDDVALIASVEGALSADPLRAEFRDWMTYNRADLEKARLVTFNDDGRHFVNRSRMQMALCGAIRQLALRCASQDARLLALEGPRPA